MRSLLCLRSLSSWHSLSCIVRWVSTFLGVCRCERRVGYIRWTVAAWWLEIAAQYSLTSKPPPPKKKWGFPMHLPEHSRFVLPAGEYDRRTAMSPFANLTLCRKLQWSSVQAPPSGFLNTSLLAIVMPRLKASTHHSNLGPVRPRRVYIPLRSIQYVRHSWRVLIYFLC